MGSSDGGLAQQVTRGGAVTEDGGLLAALREIAVRGVAGQQSARGGVDSARR